MFDQCEGPVNTKVLLSPTRGPFLLDSFLEICWSLVNNDHDCFQTTGTAATHMALE